MPHIPLPGYLTARRGWINPIKYLIRSGFRRNKPDTSPRLVYSALETGYRFLSLLATARTTSSAEYTSVLDFLRARQEDFPPERPADPGEDENPNNNNDPFSALLNPTKPPNTCPGFVPVLTRAEDRRPAYASTVRPRPLSELSGGTRKVPVLEHGRGVPFLRIGKPESRWLANYIRVKANRRQARISLLGDLYDDHYWEAEQEDAWEAVVRDLAQDEGVRLVTGEGGGMDTSVRDVAHTQPVTEAIDYIVDRLNVERADMQARAQAMVRLLTAEEKLAAEEKEARMREKEKVKEERRRVWLESQEHNEFVHI